MQGGWASLFSVGYCGDFFASCSGQWCGMLLYIGTCKVCLSLQQSTADLLCTVVELADAYEVILDEDWLSKHSATLHWGHKCCVLTKGSQRFTIVPDSGSDSETPAPFERRMCCPSFCCAGWSFCCKAFFAVYADAQPAAASCAAADGSAVAPGPSDWAGLMPESDVNALLHEYQDSFPETLPDGLSHIGRTIPLEPGSSLLLGMLTC